jgi:hypothetical protein
MFIRKLLFAFVLVAAFVDAACAASHYVRAGAAGRNDGSDWANAYTNLPAKLTRGDTYYLANGAYGSHVFSDTNSGTTVITVKKATASDHGTDIGWSSTYGTGQATFEGGWQIYTDYYVFNGAARNANWRTGAIDQYGIRVANTRLDNGAGVGGNSLTFRYIDFHGGGRDTGRGDDVIYGLTGNSNITFQYCALHDSDRTIFLMRGNWQNLTVDHSYLARNTSTPTMHGEMLSMTESTNVTWSNNVMEDIEGTAFIAGLNGGTATGWNIYGNVAFHSAAYVADTGRKAGHNYGVAGFIYVANDASNNNTGNNFRVYNNTFYNIQGTYSGVVIQLGTGNVVQNNIWYNSVRTNNSFSGTIGYNWYYNTIQDGDATGTKVVCSTNCAIFIDPASNNFDLKAPTAAGISLGSPYNIDPDGIARGGDGVWDRGAFEYGSGTSSAGTETLFTTQTPQLLNNSDGANINYELGMRFTATVAGQIKAIRFYKSPSEFGTHTGKIYSASGQLLASVTFSSETASGWQTQNLASPLSIAANTEYTVSVNTGNTYYVATDSGLASQVSNGHLKSVVGNNGVFGPVGSKPTQSWQDSNYFRDVVFVPSI